MSAAGLPAAFARLCGLRGLFRSGTVHAFALAIVVLAGLAASAPAHAQTVVTFVSNLNQSTDGFAQNNIPTAQQFTTGSNPGGFTLSGVDIISEDGEGNRFSMSVCSVAATGYPTATCTALTPPGSFEAGTLSFTAPANTVLAENTMYAVVATPASSLVHFDTTPSDAEDSGAATGWSISNRYSIYWPPWSNTSSGESLRIAIKGTAAPTFASGSVPANGWGISLILSEDIDRTAAGLPPASAFRVTKDGGTAFAPNAVTAPGNNEKSLRLGLGGAGRVRTGETVTVTYTDPTTGDDTAAIQNLDGLDAATFTDQSVTNNSTFLPPDAPKNLKAEAGDGKVELSWEAPDDNGGTAVTGYQHRHSAGTTVTTTATWSGTITDKAVTVSSLTNNTEYAFEVRAENSSGAGAPASATATPVPPYTCTVPVTTGRTAIWSGAVTVGELVKFGQTSGDGFSQRTGESTGDLSVKTFDRGTNMYTIESVYVARASAVGPAEALWFWLNVALTDDDRAALRLHVCGETFDLPDATVTISGITAYSWNDTGLDWSSATSVKLALSEPVANEPATGEPAITGVAQDSKTLTASIGTIVDLDGISAAETYQWVRVDPDGSSNETDISGATNSTYTLTSSDVGKKIRVKVSFNDDGGTDETRTSDAYPSYANVMAAKGTCPTPNDWCATLELGYTGVVTGLTEIHQFGYISGSSFGDLSSPMTFTHGGMTYTVTRVYRTLTTDLDGTTVHSHGLSITVTGGTLPDGTVLDVGGQTLTVGTDTSTTTTGQESWDLRTLGISLNWVEGGELAISLKLPVTNTAATGAPVITGTAQEGETLEATKGTIADVDVEPADFPNDYTFQWVRVDGTETDITGATNSTYMPVTADVGKTLKVKVSFTDGGGADETRTSLATAAVTAATTLPTGCPSDATTFDWCTKLTVKRSVLTSGTAYGFDEGNHGDLDDKIIDYGDDPSSAVAYTVDRLQIWDADTGNDTVIVRFTSGRVPLDTVFDFGGTQFQATTGSRVSNAYRWNIPSTLTWADAQEVTVWAKLGNFSAHGEPTITGTAQVGKTLRASTDTIADTDGKTKADAGETGYAYTYQWQRVDGTGTETAIRATGSTYTPVADDVGNKLKVQVRFTDDDDNDEASTSLATAAVTAASTGTCTAPVVVSGGRHEIWSGDVEVGDIYLSPSTILVGHGYKKRERRSGAWGDLVPGDNYDNTLRIESKSYRIVQVMVSTSGELSLRLSQQQKDSRIGSGKRAKLSLHVCGGVYELADATYYSGDMFVWSGAGLDWSDDVGAMIPVALSSSEEPDALPNNPPEFAGQSNDPVVLSVDPRVTEAGRDIGAPVTANDPDDDTVTYSIDDTLPKNVGTSKEHAKFFAIDSATGQLRSAVSFDVLTAEELVIRVKADDGQGGIAYRSVRVELDQTIPAGAPGSAGGQPASSTGTSIDVDLSVSDIGASSVTHFDVRYLDFGDRIQDPKSNFWLAGPQRVPAGPVLDSHIKHRASAVIQGLDPGTEYAVSVRAVNGHGAGAWNPGTRSPNSTTTGSTGQQTEAEPLTAAFEDLPASHDNQPFSFRIAFSEAVETDAATLRDEALDLDGGAVTEAAGVDGGTQYWDITVTPTPGAAVSIALAPTEDCAAAGALCTADGRGLSTGVVSLVAAPAGNQLTGRFENVPETHDGDAFTVELHFSRDIAMTWPTMRDHVLEMTGATVTRVRRLTQGSNQGWEITVTPASREATVGMGITPGRPCDVPGAVCTRNGKELSNALGVSIAASAAAGPAPLTASFASVPDEHDGSSEFRIELVFSEWLAVRTQGKLRRSLAVTGGSVRVFAVQRQRDRWRIKVQPSSHEAVTVSLAAGGDCAQAPCTDDGRALSQAVSTVIQGSAALSVADDEVEEGPGAELVFEVTLDRPAFDTVTVDYATSDGTATAAADYTAANGTLSFAAGETSKTVSVTVLDDAHDDTGETVTLRLSNAAGAYLADDTATGTILNSDPMPRGFMARFGRTVAVQMVEHVQERMEAPREPGFRGRIAGHELRPGMERELARNFVRQLWAAGGSHSPMSGAADPGMHETPGLAGGGVATASAGPLGAAGGTDPMSGGAGGFNGRGLLMSLGHRDVLMSSDFALNRETRGGVLSFWSRGAQSRFAGREGDLSLGGDVRTTTVGADYAKGPLVAGLSLSNSRGLGEYAGVSGGQVTSSVTGLYPWLGYKVSDRVTVWGVAGYGAGGLLLTPESGPALESGLSMAMAAAGTRGELVAGGAGGFALAFKADALWAGTAIDGVDSAVGRLAATAATRFRTGLEGSRNYTLAGRLSLRPIVEVGLRHDGGDAETGAGMDVGAGLVMSDSSTGLAVDVRVRTLLVHQAEGFRERGMAISLSYNPTPSTPLGFVARVAPSWGGQATSGAAALWGRETMAGMGHGGPAQGNRLDGEVGYGLPVGSRFVGTPRVGVSTSEYGRDYRLGYGLAVLDRGRLDVALGVDAQRREGSRPGGTDTGVRGQATLGW